VTTFRADVRAGAYALLEAFVADYATANPALAPIRAYRTRPGQFGDRPLAYVGALDEDINHTGTTLYQRTLSPEFVFVWAPDADGLADIRDDLIDDFIGYAMARPHAVSNQTVTSPTRVRDVELELDGAFYPASIVTNGDTLALEGSL
jgi:hypothetical protein